MIAYIVSSGVQNIVVHSSFEFLPYVHKCRQEYKCVYGTVQAVPGTVYTSLDFFVDIFVATGPWWHTYSPVNRMSIGSVNGLSPVLCQIINKINVNLLTIGH